MTGAEILTVREARLVAAIVASPDASQEDLAAELDVSARHVRRLMARERVRRALDAAAREGLAAGASVLGREAERAAKALAAMAMGKTKATSARVMACRAVLDGAGRLIDLVDLERQIRQLQQAQADDGEDLQ